MGGNGRFLITSIVTLSEGTVVERTPVEATVMSASRVILDPYAEERLQTCGERGREGMGE